MVKKLKKWKKKKKAKKKAHDNEGWGWGHQHGQVQDKRPTSFLDAHSQDNPYTIEIEIGSKQGKGYVQTLEIEPAKDPNYGEVIVGDAHSHRWDEGWPEQNGWGWSEDGHGYGWGWGENHVNSNGWGWPEGKKKGKKKKKKRWIKKKVEKIKAKKKKKKAKKKGNKGWGLAKKDSDLEGWGSVGKSPNGQEFNYHHKGDTETLHGPKHEYHHGWLPNQHPHEHQNGHYQDHRYRMDHKQGHGHHHEYDSGSGWGWQPSQFHYHPLGEAQGHDETIEITPGHDHPAVINIDHTYEQEPEVILNIAKDEISHGHDYTHHFKDKVGHLLHGSKPKPFVHGLDDGSKLSGFLLEKISDLPDHANAISHSSHSHLPTVIIIAATLATLGFIIHKLLQTLYRRKKRIRHKPRFGISSHHSKSISPIVQNYISFDPHQSNLGWSSSYSTTMKNRNKKNKNKNIGLGRSAWAWKQREDHRSELTGKQLYELAQFLNKYKGHDFGFHYDYDSD